MLQQIKNPEGYSNCNTRGETLQCVWVAGTDPALCEMMRTETIHWECWYMRRPAIYGDDGELIVAEIAAVSACYATGLIPQRPAAPVMLCTSENYQCISPDSIGCGLCEGLMDTMAKGYNASMHWMWHCPVMLGAAWCSSGKFFRGLLAVLLAQGPWLAQLYALLYEAEADVTHGRSRCGCYPPLHFRSRPDFHRTVRVQRGDVVESEARPPPPRLTRLPNKQFELGEQKMTV